MSLPPAYPLEEFPIIEEELPPYSSIKSSFRFFDIFPKKQCFIIFFLVIIIPVILLIIYIIKTRQQLNT